MSKSASGTLEVSNVIFNQQVKNNDGVMINETADHES